MIVLIVVPLPALEVRGVLEVPLAQAVQQGRQVRQVQRVHRAQLVPPVRQVQQVQPDHRALRRGLLFLMWRHKMEALRLYLRKVYLNLSQIHWILPPLIMWLNLR